MRPIRAITLGALAAIAIALGVIITDTGVGAAEPGVPDDFRVSTVTNDVSSPTVMEFAPDGRLFVGEKSGAIRVLVDDVFLPDPFLTVSVDANGERGLQALAFDPDFDANGYVYVSYTAADPVPHGRVSRFIAAGNTADPATEEILLEFGASSTIHQSTALHFGNDDRLYITLGDNGPSVNAQNLTNLYGKVLRINPDGSIPADNPFPFAEGDARAIWAFGLRNPFTFAVEADTDRIYINDVGFSTWEEVNEGEPGANYGWPVTEGPTNNPAYDGPLYSYKHDIGSPKGCAVTGGTFYPRDSTLFPDDYEGLYFFADLCQGWIRTLTEDGDSEKFASGIQGGIVDLDVGPDGKLYYLTHYAPSIGRIDYSTDDPPVFASSPNSTLAPVGEDVTFDVSVEGAAPISLQWQRDGVDIPGATDASYTVPAVALADDGAEFTVVATNAFGGATSDAATLSVTASTRPTAELVSPAIGSTYNGGDDLVYEATASDAEDGALPPENFTWRIDYHHDEHWHPYLPDTSGVTGGTLEIPRDDHTDTNVFFRVHLTVEDSSGLTHHTYRDVHPELTDLTLETSPPGLRVTVDGVPYETPITLPSVIGVNRTVGVETPQPHDGKTYEFASWSDAGDESHTITTPSSPTTYVASFDEIEGDHISIHVSEPAPQEVVGTLVDGDFAVRQDTSGKVVSLAGTGSALGTHGQPIEVTVNARRLIWFIPLFFGSVRIHDTATGSTFRAQMLFAKIYGGGPGKAIGHPRVYDFSRFPFKFYNVGFEITDRV